MLPIQVTWLWLLLQGREAGPLEEISVTESATPLFQDLVITPFSKQRLLEEFGNDEFSLLKSPAQGLD